MKAACPVGGGAPCPPALLTEAPAAPHPGEVLGVLGHHTDWQRQSTRGEMPTGGQADTGLCHREATRQGAERAEAHREAGAQAIPVAGVRGKVGAGLTLLRRPPARAGEADTVLTLRALLTFALSSLAPLVPLGPCGPHFHRGCPEAPRAAARERAVLLSGQECTYACAVCVHTHAGKGCLRSGCPCLARFRATCAQQETWSSETVSRARGSGPCWQSAGGTQVWGGTCPVSAAWSPLIRPESRGARLLAGGAAAQRQASVGGAGGRGGSGDAAEALAPVSPLGGRWVSCGEPWAPGGRRSRPQLRLWGRPGEAVISAIRGRRCSDEREPPGRDAGAACSRPPDPARGPHSAPRSQPCGRSAGGIGHQPRRPHCRRLPPAHPVCTPTLPGWGRYPSLPSPAPRLSPHAPVPVPECPPSARGRPPSTRERAALAFTSCPPSTPPGFLTAPESGPGS